MGAIFRQWLLLGLLFFALGTAPNAWAVYLVDTGPGSIPPSGPALNLDQWLAAEFDLSGPTTVTGIYGWISPILARAANPYTGAIHLAIYDDGGDIPGSELFSQQLSISSRSANHDWYGLSGLDWAVPGGTYWVSFEVRPGDSFVGTMSSATISPLANEAFASSAVSYTWRTWDAADIGVRILGPVPEPGTLVLLGSGLIGLTGYGRRRKQ